MLGTGKQIVWGPGPRMLQADVKTIEEDLVVLRLSWGGHGQGAATP